MRGSTARRLVLAISLCGVVGCQSAGGWPWWRRSPAPYVGSASAPSAAAQYAATSPATANPAYNVTAPSTQSYGPYGAYPETPTGYAGTPASGTTAYPSGAAPSTAMADPYPGAGGASMAPQVGHYDPTYPRAGGSSTAPPFTPYSYDNAVLRSPGREGASASSPNPYADRGGSPDAGQADAGGPRYSTGSRYDSRSAYLSDDLQSQARYASSAEDPAPTAGPRSAYGIDASGAEFQPGKTSYQPGATGYPPSYRPGGTKDYLPASGASGAGSSPLNSRNAAAAGSQVQPARYENYQYGEANLDRYAPPGGLDASTIPGPPEVNLPPTSRQ